MTISLFLLVLLIAYINCRDIIKALGFACIALFLMRGCDFEPEPEEQPVQQPRPKGPPKSWMPA